KGTARAFDPTLWRDPSGKLWYIFNRGDKETAKHGVYARICDDPDAGKPVWGPEFHLGYKTSPYSFRMNKPVVLSSGEWIMPVTHAVELIYDWFAGPRQLQGVGVSVDQGKSWELYGYLKAPAWALENMEVELRDGRIWMLIRTGGGVLWESFSSDKGRTWTDAAPGKIANPGSRFYIRRLASGNLLLVNHFKNKGRSHLTAQLSTDDGKTWNDGLLLDERSGVSYPDGVQDSNGLIWMVHDRDRQGAGEILLSTFREEDVVAGKNVSGAVRLKQVVSRLDKPQVVSGKSLLPANWNPKEAGDKVMARLINVSGPQVKGAHDGEFVIVDDRAYIVSIANDNRAGENPVWEDCYAAMSVVHVPSGNVERFIPFARSGQVFGNETLPAGACFVPRILRKDDNTLRCWFASEQPGKRQTQLWQIDYDLRKQAFENRIQRTKIRTATGVFDFQPQHLYNDAVANGFTREAKDYGSYAFSFYKSSEGQTYAVLNNYPGAQNALSLLNADMDTFEVLGHYNEPKEMKLTESAVNRLPDGTWISISRQEGGTHNYVF
ncbi:MAG TPA: sialidase family protein, partial [Roseimicrobium sp.]|nr:sialidase family protein [Roseimicrobium sp.]